LKHSAFFHAPFTVKNYGNLLIGVQPGIQVVILNVFQDGVQRFSNALVNHHSFSSLPILTHGNWGTIPPSIYARSPADGASAIFL
jgi:Domain of unknown function (DUF4347)